MRRWIRRSCCCVNGSGSWSAPRPSRTSSIYETLSSLGEETRTALSLREFDGLSYEEIAEIVQCPVGTVRSRIFRGREIIEEMVGKHMQINSNNENKKIS